jgi:peptidoglycan/LPS O-acetylase OafA/YrhL
MPDMNINPFPDFFNKNTVSAKGSSLKKIIKDKESKRAVQSEGKNKNNTTGLTSAASFGYRPDIDGLRAIAVLSVVIFHLNREWLPGGFVGVDVFFVISGYLISFIVYGEIRSNKFSFKNFYARRINRIVPALFSLILANVLVGILILSPMDLLKLVKSGIYSMVGISNFFFWKEYGNYFSSGMEEAPLLNTWSLAVEEQFYVLWPLLLILLARLSKRYLVIFLLTGLILATGISQYGAQNVASASYYLLPARFFELLIGCCLALLSYHRGVILVGIGATVAGTIGFALMFGSFFLLDDSRPFPGLNALYPCIGAALLIVSGSYSKGVCAQILSSKVLVFFGLISYSLYLLHWPIIAYSNYVDINIDAHVALLIFLVSTFLAWLSWRFIEMPFRRNKLYLSFGVLVSRRYITPVILVTAISFLVIKLNGLPDRFDPRVSSYEAIISTAPDVLRDGCHVPTIFYRNEPNAKCRLGENSKPPDGIMIGDSYANHFTGMIDVLAKRDGVAIMDYTMAGCLPIQGVMLGKQSAYAEKCKLRNDYSYKHIQSKHYKYVILAGSWPNEGSVELLAEFERGLAQSIRIIVESGSKPIIVLSNPRIKNASKCPVRRLLFNREESCEVVWRKEDAYRNIFKKIEKEYPEARFIDPSMAICDDETCKSQIGDVPLYRDDGHLNEVGSRLIGQILLDKGVRLLPLEKISIQGLSIPGGLASSTNVPSTINTR